MRLIEALKNSKYTENGAEAYASTLNKVYDMFAFAGAYRNRSDEDVVTLFKEAAVMKESGICPLSFCLKA